MSKSIDRTIELPGSWEYINIGESIDKISLTGKKLKKSQYQGNAKLPVIDQGQHFIGGRTDREELKISCDSPLVVFGDHTKVVKYVDFDFVAGADGIKVIKPKKIFYPKLFYYFIQAIRLPDKGYARHFQFLEKSDIPLPPLPEQHHIVDKIEELFTKLDAGIEYLKKAQAPLKQYRQAFLKAAVEGRLTQEWREAHKDELEPASVLLERILKARREKWETEQLELFEAKGKKPKDGRWKGKHKEPVEPNAENLPDLPEGWIWASLDQLAAHIVDCLHSTPEFSSEGKYCIDTTCIEPGRILFEDARFVSEETYQERIRRLKPEAGDILFAREGTIGTSVIVPNNVELCLGQRMMMFRAASSVEPVYFMCGLHSPVFQRQWKPKVTGTTAPHINIGDIKTMALPLPPVEEQKLIVSELERRLSIIDGIETTIESDLKRTERLRQSILKQAFSGKLVPQDPSDEPASILLERIKAEKAARETEKKRARESKAEQSKEPQQMELL